VGSSRPHPPLGLDRTRSWGPFLLRVASSLLRSLAFGMGPNRRAQERERAAALAAERAKHVEADRKAVADAQKIVAIWNARRAGGRALWFYPTIGAAIAAGLPWLSFSCPACGQWGSVDLRTLDRHPEASISGLIPTLSCRRCSPHPPFARLEMLTAERTVF
jgi:hypothetical protein